MIAHNVEILSHLSLGKELYVTAGEAPDLVQRLAATYNEQFADSSQIPTFFALQLARRSVTPALSVDGGDELFDGCNRHLWVGRAWRGMRRLRRWARTSLGRGLDSVHPGTWERWFAAAGPFLSSSLPLSLKIRDGQSKWVLRQVLYRHVPRELIERPKTGFGIPLGEWLRGPLRERAEELLSERRLDHEGFFRPAPIRAAWNEHLAGTRAWEHQLWAVLMFQAWFENIRAGRQLSGTRA